MRVSASDLQKCVGAYGVSEPHVEIVLRGEKLFVVIADQQDELRPQPDRQVFISPIARSSSGLTATTAGESSGWNCRIKQ